MEIKNLSYVMVGASDVERSVEFYRDVLGLQLKARFEGFAFLDTGPTTLALSGELWQPRAGSERQPFELVFSVDSVGTVYESLKRCITFVNEPRQVNEESWAVNFSDPDGHPLSLYGPR